MSSRANDRDFLAGFSFARLIEPVSTQTFFDTHWERQPLVIRRDRPDFYGDLVTVAEIDAVIAHDPNVVKFANSNDTDPGRHYTWTAVDGDAERILGEVGRRSSVVLGGAHRRLTNLGRMCRLLSAELSYQFHANIYMTPAGGRAFVPHFDPYDVFVLQVVGSKLWRVETERRFHPVDGQMPDLSGLTFDGNTEDIRLDPGDLHYLPAGYVHNAVAEEFDSVHVTIGVRPNTWHHALAGAVELAVAEREDLRRGLPPGFLAGDREAISARLSALFAELADRQFTDRAVDKFLDEAITQFPADLSGLIEATYGGRPLTPATVLAPRTALIYALRESEDAVTVLVGGRRIEFPGALAAAIRFCLDGNRFEVRAIPADLDDDDKVVLAHRLLEEGLVERRDSMA
jgi:hypothetical protein